MAGSLHASSLPEVLHSPGPSPELGAGADLYDRLIGSWDVTVYEYPQNGSRRELQGEWHFGWVLEGRAIEDVFIVPPRSQRTAGTAREGNRYGATLRMYDAARDEWRITWFNPVTLARNDLIARRDTDGIFQEGATEDGGLTRWIFTEIHPESFRWRAETSMDGGKTWRLTVEFLARRR